MKKVQAGLPAPLGSIIKKGGVNFSVYAPYVTRIQLLLFRSEEDTNPDVYELDPHKNRTYYYWHIFIEGIGKNQLYAYRVDGKIDLERGRLADFSKVLIDPYARVVIGKHSREKASIYGYDNIDCCLKSAVVSYDFDWQGYEKIDCPESETIIYELHVGAFTKNENSGVTPEKRGTYRGLIEKIPYLKKLGINTVELMPVYAFDEQDAPIGKTNFWGYSPLNFFAPHSAYSSETEPQKILAEFKEMVREFHKNHIKIVLDVVYNHTAETNYNGPFYSFKGFANSVYYIIDEEGKYLDYTGCGNTICANHSIVRRMIQHSLKYWVRDMNIDGFRFDLASALARDEHGIPTENPPVLWSIDSEPLFSSIDLIAEPWDAVGLNLTNDFPGDKWKIWDEKFRDTVRAFVQGINGKTREFAYRVSGGEGSKHGRHFEFPPGRNLHYVTCHDGFTMNDLVSYREKHNFANEEENRDGTNNNLSWNCGIEGETDILLINQIREKYMKNMFMALITSHGIPMILMGDEVKRTQQGNNNAYCQDNEISWFNWELVEKNEELFNFVKQLIAFRKRVKIFSYEGYYKSEFNDKYPFVISHGVKLDNPDFGYYSNSIAQEYCYLQKKENIYIIYNSYTEDLDFELPYGSWEIVISSGLKNTKMLSECFIKVEAQSSVILEKK